MVDRFGIGRVYVAGGGFHSSLKTQIVLTNSHQTPRMFIAQLVVKE